MSTNTLPEIREGEAPREIALIYADIRHCMHLPLVNLIYRHFATFPGVLPQVWGSVRAMILSGEPQAALDRMKRSLSIPQLARFDQRAFASLGVVHQAAIRRVLEAYNRGNGLNLITLTAVISGTHERPLGRFEISEAISYPALLPLPRLLKLTELDPATRDQVAAIARLHDSGSGVVPSLYLHLAHWPGFLTAVCVQITPLLKAGSIEQTRQVAVKFAESESNRLLSMLPARANTVEIPEEALNTLERFISRVIPEMLLIGLAIEKALPRC